MKKIILSIAVIAAASATAFAGGYLTNTNQNVAFLRQPARNATIGVEGAYFNPAGIGFMNNGWHFGLDIQSVRQRRYAETTFAPFAYGVENNGKDTKKFTGKTFAPAIPHLDVAYVHNNWFASFHFGVMAGGGEADYDEGLGSFEAPIAMLPALINKISGATTVSGYAADINFVGEQYSFSGQFNFGYKFNSHLSASAGLRLNYVNNSYEGGIYNINLKYGGNVLPAAQVLGGIISNVSGGTIDAAAGTAMAGKIVGDKELNCKQTDFAYTPIVSVHYETGKFDFAARYEFRTKVALENDTEINTTGIAQYNDGLTVRNDIPAMLAVGGQYKILPSLRFSLGYNLFFDKQAKQFGNKQDFIDNNTWEGLAGLEYDINKSFTVSCGVNTTTYGYTDAYISDMNLTTDSVNIGVGGRYNINDRMSVDVAFYKSFYSDYTKTSDDYAGVGHTYYTALSSMASLFPGLTEDALKTPGTETYSRNSFVIGVGFNISF